MVLTSSLRSALHQLFVNQPFQFFEFFAQFALGGIRFAQLASRFTHVVCDRAQSHSEQRQSARVVRREIGAQGIGPERCSSQINGNVRGHKARSPG